MQSLSNTSRVLANELRSAERSINIAARDTAQFLLTTLEATEAHRLSPAMAHRTVKATVAALSSLILGQDQMVIRAHSTLERVGRDLGLTETNWGEGAPKPPMGSLPEQESETS